MTCLSMAAAMPISRCLRLGSRSITRPRTLAADRFNSNGNLDLQNYFSLDGVDNNSGSTNLQEGSVQVVQPPPDALQEFRVQTRTYSAEFGTSAGAVINASIRSGTNQFHGGVFEFLRNDKLDANTFFNNANGVRRGHFSQNQFGGTLGGPIVPSKTFFFGDFQRFTSRKATTINSIVPTPLMKQGNFTELPYALSDSAVTGQSGCVAGNILKGSCIDTVGSKLLALFPGPNIPSAVARLGVPGSWTGGNNYQFPYSVPNDTWSVDGRVDHSINQRNQVFGRYSYYHVERQDPPWTSNPVAGNGNFATQYLIRGQSVALAWTDTLSSSTLNQFTFGFNRLYAHSDPIGVSLGKSLAPDFGLTGIPEGPNTAGLPPINIGQLTRLGSSPWRPQWQISQVWQFLDNLSWLKGKHSFKFGYEYRTAGNTFLDIQAPGGQITANGIYTNNRGFGAADFLLGDISSAQFTTPLVVHNYMPGNSFYAQDSWRVKPNLTVTYGLRYELFAPLLNRQNQVSNFSPANGGTIVSVSPDAGGWLERTTIHPDKNDFAPRFGFSYGLWDRLVLRGGYGMFYQHSNRIGSESVLELNPPFLIDGLLSQQLGSTTPVFMLKNGFPAAQFTPALVNLRTLQIRAQDPDQRSSYVQQVSFGPEFQLTHDMALSAAYVGNFGRKMNRLRNANQGVLTGADSLGNPIITFPYANLNSTLQSVRGAGQHAFLELATNDGNTNYNAFEISLRRTFARGLGFGANYTWSHNIAEFVDNLTGGSTPANAYRYDLERSNSILDVRHRFVGNLVWTLPIGEGGRILVNRGAASRWLGGWQFNAIVALQTGNPFTATATDRSFTGSGHANRASCIGDPFAGASSDPHQYVPDGSGFLINPAAFATPKDGEFGSCAPRSFYGPGIQNFDLSLFKNFKLTEGRRIEFRTEFFNALNRANFAQPRASFSTPASFGKVFGTRLEPRDIQFALKFQF